MKNSRDFIDFLIALRKNKNNFLYIWFLVTLVAVFININSAGGYKFKSLVKVASDEAFSSSTFFQQELLRFKHPKKNDLNILSRVHADSMVSSALNSNSFYELLTDKYIKSEFYNPSISKKDVHEEIIESVEYIKNYQELSYQLEVKIKHKSIAYYLYNNFYQELKILINTNFQLHHKELMKSTKRLLSYKADFEVEQEKVKVKNMAYKVNSKGNIPAISLKESLKDIDEHPEKYSLSYRVSKFVELNDIPASSKYLTAINGKVVKTSRIGIYLALIMSLFLSIFLFFGAVLFYDVIEQIKVREKKSC